jgi:hypothetical protein
VSTTTAPVSSRPRWDNLPNEVRAMAEERQHARFVDAVYPQGGFTTGLATLVSWSDGTRSFMKGSALNAPMASHYRRHTHQAEAMSPPQLEAEVRAALEAPVADAGGDSEIPSPRHVGRAPGRWRRGRGWPPWNLRCMIKGPAGRHGGVAGFGEAYPTL